MKQITRYELYYYTYAQFVDPHYDGIQIQIN